MSLSSLRRPNFAEQQDSLIVFGGSHNMVSSVMPRAHGMSKAWNAKVKPALVSRFGQRVQRGIADLAQKFTLPNPPLFKRKIQHIDSVSTICSALMLLSLRGHKHIYFPNSSLITERYLDPRRIWSRCIKIPCIFPIYHLIASLETM